MWELITQIDGKILLLIQEYLRVNGLNQVMMVITSLGDGGMLWIILSALMLFHPRTRKAGYASLASLLLGFLVTNLTLKPLVARIRPYDQISGLTALIARPGGFSFPSGHTCSSWASAMVFYWMLPKRAGTAAVIAAALISFSRLYVGVHFPTDVLAGGLIGAGSAWLVCQIFTWMESHPKA